MENVQLITEEWNQVAWGNIETHLEFLQRVGFAPTKRQVLEIGSGKGALLNRLSAAGHEACGLDPDVEAGYWALRRRFEVHGFKITFFDVPVVNDYFVTKMRTYVGSLGPALVKVLNPDRFPMFMRTNFYAKAVLHATAGRVVS